MPDTGRSNLLYNGFGTSKPFFDGGKELYSKRGWMTTENYVEEYFDIPANGSSHSRGGAVSVIELDRRGDLCGDMWLHWERTAFSTATGMKILDYEGPSSIDTVTFMYNNKPLWEVRGETLIQQTKERCTPQQLSAIQRLEMGGDGIDRTVTVVTAQNSSTRAKIWCNLQVPWRKIKKYIEFTGLPNKLRVEIKWKPVNSLVQQASGSIAGGTISELNLRCKFVHLPQETRSKHFMMTQSATGVKFKGISYEEHYQEPLTCTLTAGGGLSQEFSVELRNIRNDVIVLRTYLQSAATVNTVTTLDNDESVFLPHVAYLRDNGSAVTTEFDYSNENNHNTGTTAFAKYKDSVEMFPTSHPGTNIGKIPFCNNKYIVASEDDCFGSRNIGRYNNPTLVIRVSDADGINATATPNLLLTVRADIHQIFIQLKGDFRRYLL